jgi:hypothetical protein
MRLVFACLILLSNACQPTEFRSCPNGQTNVTKHLYQDVVTEIIEHRLGHAYLPEQDRQVFWQHFQQADRQVPTAEDSAWQHEQEVRLQNHLFQDTARFQTFYLNTSADRRTLLADLPAQFASLPSASPLAALLLTVAPTQPQAAVECLNSLQQEMQAEEFQLCTAKLQAAVSGKGNMRQVERGQGMGTLSLSKVVFNARKDQALVAFGWRCGPRCGYGEVLLVEKQKGRWRIKRAEPTWIS